MDLRIDGGRSRHTGNSTRSRIEVGTGRTTRRPREVTGRTMSMTMKTLLGSTAASAQAPIALGHLTDYSGPTSDVGTPFGQGVADTYAWINKSGGINGAKVNLDTVDYGYQVPRAIAQYKKWSGADKVAAILGWGTADTEAL